LLRSADTVCCTPWYEPFGLVAVEAMACGVPIVATRVGGLAETVRDGVTGCLVPPRDPTAIADALRRILHQPDLALSMRAQAVRRAERYGWDLVAARTLRVLQDLAQTGRGPATAIPRAATACRAAPDRSVDSTLGPVQ
jgi:glycosyltransferase involved in cell wall biosynthesis